MTREEQYFELLLSEKRLADSMVGGYADLGLRVFGMFGVGGVLLGWLVSNEGPAAWSEPIGVACIALSVASCGIVVHGVFTYCLTLGYVQYRNQYLNEAFQKHLELSEPPIQAVRRWRDGAAREPTELASAFIAILHGICCCTLLLIASYSMRFGVWSVVALLVGWVVLVATLVVEAALRRAMKKVFDNAL